MPTRPAILDLDSPQQRTKAVQHLRTYFGLDGQPAYTGSRFEFLGGGGDQAATANLITAEDLLALSMLSIRVHGTAVLALIENEKTIERTTRLLEQIPTGIDLAYADPTLLTEGSPAWELWFELMKLRQFGPTTTSKLMARKRPQLIPVFDTVIGRAFQIDRAVGQWDFWHEMLTNDKKRLHHQLLELREEAGVPSEVSALRVLDVVVWMEHRTPADEVDEADEAAFVSG